MAIPAPFTDQQIADQLTRGGNYWYGNNGDTTIYYSFSSSLGYWWGNTGEYALDATQQAWTETALDMLSELFDLNFVETAEPANTAGNQPIDIIQFVNDTNTGTYSSSYTYTSGPNTGGIAFNAIVYDQTWTSNQSANLDYGSYGFMTMLHEILHSLGLEHPGNYDAGAGVPITYQNDAEFEQDTHRYSVMSYFSAENDGSGAVFWDFVNAEWVYPRTPMVYDILAMTSGAFDGNFAGYGFNTTTRNTDTTYGYNATSGINEAYDFAAHGAPVLTLYDTGGIDTLDLSGDTVSQQRIVNYGAGGVVSSYSDVARTTALIDLREGHYSSTHGMTYNIGIAFGTVIENAIGTQYNDEMYGNSARNVLLGGNGNDTMSGLESRDWLFGQVGNDTLTGGADDDFFVFDNNQTNTGDVVTDYASGDTVYFGNRSSAPTFSLSGGDVIVNGVTLTGAASGNVNVITQASGAALTASTTALSGVLATGNTVLASIAGAYTRTVFDADGNESWTTDVYSHDASGALDYRTINYDAGSRLFINYDQTNTNGWSQIADTYNASNQLTQKVTTLDTGSYYSTVYDVAGTQAWTQSTTGKDASNQTDYQDITYDDNTRIFTDYDQAGTQIWVTALTFYNASAQQTARRVNYDDGHYEVTYQDYTGTESWTQKIDTYTDGVNRDYVNFYNDDGTRKTTDFDQLGAETWSVREVLYNASNQATSINTVYDDGTRILKSFDPTDANNTQEVTVGYDAGGLADYISTLYDDDTRITRDFDQNDDFAWAEHVFVYDSGGNLTNDYYTY